MFCPEGVVTGGENEQEVEIDYDFCKGCGICAQQCSKQAIDMESESK